MGDDQIHPAPSGGLSGDGRLADARGSEQEHRQPVRAGCLKRLENLSVMHKGSFLKRRPRRAVAPGLRAPLFCFRGAGL